MKIIEFISINLLPTLGFLLALVLLAHILRERRSPTVTATQDPALRSLLDVAAVAQGLANFLRLPTDELTVLLVRYLVGVFDVSTPYGRWWINEAG